MLSSTSSSQYMADVVLRGHALVLRSMQSVMVVQHQGKVCRYLQCMHQHVLHWPTYLENMQVLGVHRWHGWKKTWRSAWMGAGINATIGHI